MIKHVRAAAAIVGLGLFGGGSFSSSRVLFASAQEEEDAKMTALFVNELPNDAIELYWENPNVPDDHPNRRRLTGMINPRGSFLSTETFVGHEFSYVHNGSRHYVMPKNPNSFGEQFVILNGDADSIRVRCEVTASSQAYSDFVDIVVKPYWAPRAVSRFLELVPQKYYDGVAFNRVVPKFLIQFGIAADYAVRTEERDRKLWDDFGVGIKFDPGFLSFAGSGPDSRTTEVFVAMPGASRDQLSRFGDNPWEVPFGYVENVETSAFTKVHSGYGDMPPWGKGPESNRIYEADGYTKYLPKNFPKLDYIERCYVVDEVGLDESEGEF